MKLVTSPRRFAVRSSHKPCKFRWFPFFLTLITPGEVGVGCARLHVILKGEPGFGSRTIHYARGCG